MHPILFRYGSLEVPTYSFCVISGLLISYFLARRIARDYGYTSNVVNPCFFWTIVVGFWGTRILNALVDAALRGEFSFDVLSGGLTGGVWYGAILFGAPALWWCTKHYQIPTLRACDIGSVTVAFCHPIGRLGCFFAGCCHGRPTDVPWAVVFDSPGVAPEVRGIPVHPTQIYEALGELVIATTLYTLLRRSPPRDEENGRLFLLYIVSYGALRFVVEFFRGDSARGFFMGGWISTSQGIALLAASAALLALLRYRPSGESPSRKIA